MLSCSDFNANAAVFFSICAGVCMPSAIAAKVDKTGW